MLKRLLFVIVLLVGLVPAHAQDEPICNIPPAYGEQLIENLETLDGYKITQETLDDIETLERMAIALAEMRQYHEDAVKTLPYCAFELNRLMIEAVSAYQDATTFSVLAYADIHRGRNVVKMGYALGRFEEKIEALREYAEYLDE